MPFPYQFPFYFYELKEPVKGIIRLTTVPRGALETKDEMRSILRVVGKVKATVT